MKKYKDLKQRIISLENDIKLLNKEKNNQNDIQMKHGFVQKYLENKLKGYVWTEKLEYYFVENNLVIFWKNENKFIQNISVYDLDKEINHSGYLHFIGEDLFFKDNSSLKITIDDFPKILKMYKKKCITEQEYINLKNKKGEK